MFSEIMSVNSAQVWKSLFEVGGPILGEGGYFIILLGTCAIFSPSWQILGEAIARVAPRGLHPWFRVKNQLYILLEQLFWNFIIFLQSLIIPFEAGLLWLCQQFLLAIHSGVGVVIVNSRFLKLPQMRSRGNQLIHRHLAKTKSTGRRSRSRESGRQQARMATVDGV